MVKMEKLDKVYKPKKTFIWPHFCNNNKR